MFTRVRQKMTFLFKRNPKKHLTLFVLLFALLGAAALQFSRAEDLSTSKDANTVIIQYQLPHSHGPGRDPAAAAADEVPSPQYPALTLYGDGLLVCGPAHDQAAPAKAGLATSTRLSQEQISDLVRRISDTGFLSLKHEYYNMPVAENQQIIRLNLQGDDHFVMYYGDTEEPAAYKATADVLEDTCKGVKETYVPDKMVVQARKLTDTKTLPSQAVEAKSLKSKAGEALDKAATKIDTSPVLGQASAEVDGKVLPDILESFSQSPRQLVKRGADVYSVGIVQQYPAINNPLRVNYDAIRATESTKTGWLNKLKKVFGSEKAYAADTKPVRIVILVPSNMQKYDTNGLTLVARYTLKNMQSWYCQVGSCYNGGETNYQFIRGNLTQSAYERCPAGATLCNYPTDAIMWNVYNSDKDTIYRQDVDTLVLPAWDSGEYAKYGTAGGLALVGSTLAIMNPFVPTYATNGQSGIPRTMIAVHEIGHTFGLGHVTPPGAQYTPMDQYADGLGRQCSINKEDPYYPECVLNSEQISFLKGTAYFPPVASTSTSGGTTGGTTGGNTGGTTAPALVNLYKYYNAFNIDNLYSTNPNDAAKTSYGYSYHGCMARLYNGQVAGTVPLYRYFAGGNNNAFGGDSFYTTTRNDSGYAANGYGYVGITGYVFSSQQAGTVPLKRYFASAPFTDHFYTTGAWTNGYLGYYFETNEGYVYPPTSDCGPTDPAPPTPQRVALYHYYSPAQVDNFYTTNFYELGYGGSGYEYHGCSAWVWDRPVPGSVPLYRYYNGIGGDHFYTVDRNDAGYAAYGYTYYEGIVGNVFTDGRIGGTTAFNRYFAGGAATDHFYTQDAWTNGFLGYYFERTEAYNYNHNNFTCPR